MQQNSKATIKDIAKYADVSIATVSRYINQNGKVHTNTAARIQNAIEHFGYIPNDNARALRSKSERIIGLILPDISNAFFAKVFKSLEELLFKEKIFVLLCNSNEDSQKEQEYLYRLLQKRVDAIVIAPTGVNDNLIKSINQTTPVIIFDRKQENIYSDQLFANDEDSTSILTNHILDCGHRHIAYSLGVPNSNTTKNRYCGFIKAMEKRGFSSSNYTLMHAQDEISCRKEFHNLLLQHYISAIIITSPKKLHWFLIERNQIASKGIKSNLSFVGYATQSEFDICDIPLTGMLQKEEFYAKNLAEIIINRLNKPDSKKKVIELKLDFHQGKSALNSNSISIDEKIQKI